MAVVILFVVKVKHKDITTYQLDHFHTFDCLNNCKPFFGIQNVHEACYPRQDENWREMCNVL